MKCLRISKTLILCVCLSGAPGAATLGWFGNSFSDAGKVYSQVTTMINCHTCGITEDRSLTLTAYITPGCWLTCQEDSGALSRIDKGHFDYVVAQDNVANFLVYGGTEADKINSDQLANWATHAKNAGGTLVIEQIWLRVNQTTPRVEWTRENQDWSDRWYDSVAHATGSILSPNGHAWFNAYQVHPEFAYTDTIWNDMMHPGPFGAYLNACCFFSAFTGVSPVGHTNRKIQFRGDSLTLPDSQAIFAQQQAWEAYRHFNSSSAVRLKSAFVKPAPAASRVKVRLERSGISIREAGSTGVHVFRPNGSIISVHSNNK